MRKRTLCLLMAAIISIGTFTYAAAADVAARTVSIFKIEGKDVKMTKGTEKEFAAKAGVKLFGGYTVSTGKDSYAYLKLDEDSLIKMDQKSKIKVNKQTSKKLSVSVLSGGLAVDAATQTGDKSMEIRAGNSALAIRGTYFVAEITPNGTKFTMFEGEGEMSDGTKVPHGKMLIITENEDGSTSQELVDIAITGDESAFLLQNIIDNAEMLKDSGILTDDDLNKVQELLDNMPEDTTAAELAGLGVTDSGQKYYSTETPKGTGGSGGGNTSKAVFVVENLPSSPPTYSHLFSSDTLKGACDAITQHQATTSGNSYRITIKPSVIGTYSTYQISDNTEANSVGNATSNNGNHNIDIIIEQQMTFEVPSGVIFNVNDWTTVTNYGTFKNGGGLNAGGSFINSGEFTNSGNMTFTSGTGSGYFGNKGTFYNSGSVEFSFGGRLNNGSYGTMTPGTAGTFNNSGTVEISNNGEFINIAGSFVNSGYVTIKSAGMFENDDRFYNSNDVTIATDSVNGDGIFYNYDEFNNYKDLFILGEWHQESTSTSIHGSSGAKITFGASITINDSNGKLFGSNGNFYDDVGDRIPSYSTPSSPPDVYVWNDPIIDNGATITPVGAGWQYQP